MAEKTASVHVSRILGKLGVSAPHAGGGDRPPPAPRLSCGCAPTRSQRVGCGVRFPGEWEHHERTLMGWPCRRELWGSTLEQARADYAAVANAIAAFEPVTMIANAGEDAAQAGGRAAGVGRDR